MRGLPAGPLLDEYVAAGPATADQLGDDLAAGPRARAVFTARADWLADAFLDAAGADVFRAAAVDFANLVSNAATADAVGRHAALVRFAVAHLVRCPDSAPRKIERCVHPNGPYFVAGVSPSFWAALLQATDPRQLPSWSAVTFTGLRRLGFALDEAARPAVVYRAARSAYRELRRHAPTLSAPHFDHFLTLVARMPGRELWDAADEPPTRGTPGFAGFCSDTFRLLKQLGVNNSRAWLSTQRGRYRFAVREPMVELGRALAQRYIVPVLARGHGWDLEADPRPGRSLSCLARNDFGRGLTYNDALWLSFHRRNRPKRDEAQLFVKLSADGVSGGFRFGRAATDCLARFRAAVRDRAGELWRTLRANGAADTLRFANGPDVPNVADAVSLRAWADAAMPSASVEFGRDDAILRCDELVGELQLIFDRVVPLFAAATEPDAARWPMASGDPRRRFRSATYLSDEWLSRAESLVRQKRQLILHGPPGTGKTHAARAFAEYLTEQRPGSVRMVQFHPAFGYEEFVEGIRVRAVETDGRSELRYPVEDGVLVALAAEAEREPASPFVLLIDELNRGNLPRILGELLYLLEYRDSPVTLPVSGRSFRLPANVIVLGTMNAADRSAVPLDRALRRRFAFVEMAPDAEVLRGWLADHPPRGGPAFAGRVERLFTALNARLRHDFGPGQRIGHSYFLVPDLDEAALERVWTHQIRPALDELATDRPERLDEYRFERMWKTAGREAKA